VLGNIPAIDERTWGFSIECVEHLGDERSPVRIDDLDVTGETRAEMTYADHCLRLEPVAASMRVDGTWAWAHPWIDVFVPSSRAESFVASALDTLTPADVGRGWVMTYPLRRKVSSTPLFRLPDSPVSFLFDVLPAVPLACTEQWLRRADALTRRALDVGSTLYPIGSATIDDEMWASHFGGVLSNLRAWKRLHDPHGVFRRAP
jgi:hypothetical protein